MKNVKLYSVLAVIGLFALQGCAVGTQMVENITPPYSQTANSGDVVDSGLMDKYDYLITRGDKVEILPIEGNILPESRGYFKFNDMNDVNYDEVIISGDIVTRFRGGSPQIMDIENLLEMVVGDHFIMDNDPR